MVMSDERHSWDVLTDAWNAEHPGWQVVDHHLTVSWVPWGQVDVVVVIVQHLASGTLVNGVGSDLVTALQDVTYVLEKRAQRERQPES
jgi:hypothetical protein